MLLLFMCLEHSIALFLSAACTQHTGNNYPQHPLFISSHTRAFTIVWGLGVDAFALRGVEIAVASGRRPSLELVCVEGGSGDVCCMLPRSKLWYEYWLAHR